MQNLLAKLKDHPWWIGGGIFVIGLILIYYYTRGGSSGGQVVVGGGPNPAQLQADVQLAGIQASAAATTHGQDVALQALGVKGASDFALAQLQAQTAGAALGVQQNVAQLQASVESHAQDTQLAAVLAQFQSNETEVALRYSTDLQEKQAQDALAIAIEQSSTAQNEFIAQTQAGVVAQQIQSNVDVAAINASTAQKQIQSAIDLSQIAATVQENAIANQAETQQFVAAQQGETTRYLADQQVVATQIGLQRDVTLAQLAEPVYLRQLDDAASVAYSQAMAAVGVAKAQASSNAGLFGPSGVGGLLGGVGSILKAVI